MHEIYFLIALKTNNPHISPQLIVSFNILGSVENFFA